MGKERVRDDTLLLFAMIHLSCTASNATYYITAVHVSFPEFTTGHVIELHNAREMKRKR